MQMANLKSDAFVFFGATGDLACKQIFPALQAMIKRGHFDMPIIGVARSAKSVDELLARAHESLEKHGGVDAQAFATLSARLQYVSGDYGIPETFRNLRKALGVVPTIWRNAREKWLESEKPTRAAISARDSAGSSTMSR